MKTCGRCRQKGFSLIEVLIAMTLLAVGLLAVASMQTTAMSANTVSRDGTVAVQMAEEMVERLRVNAGNFPVRYNLLSTSGTSCTTLDEPAKGDCLQWKSRLGNTSLRNAIGTVGVVNNSPMENTATATITVRWGGHSIQMTTIVETWGI